MGSGVHESKKYGLLIRPKTLPSIIDKLFEEGYRFNFFHAVSILEKIYQDSVPLGAEGPLYQEKIRFRANPSLTFPASDIASIHKTIINSAQNQNTEIVQLVLKFMGLYGVNSPLPLYITKIISVLASHDEKHELVQESEEDGIKALRNFLDIFDHRIYSLYYRSWKKYRYYLHYKKEAKDHFSQYMLSLIGLGSPELQNMVGLDVSRLLAYIGIIGPQNRCPEGLQSLISDYFGGLEVKITEFVPRWVPIPQQFKARVGKGKKETRAKLGENINLGNRIRDFRGKFRIAIGPLRIEDFRKFLPGGSESKKLNFLVGFYMLNQFSFDVKLLLRKEDVPAMQLGSKDIQIGWISWLGKPQDDVVSVVFR
jgi:type VI secretion system protein ImpH